MSVLLVLGTFPDEASATAAARTLVEERLAACVNRLPGIASTYVWEGAVREDTEVLLLAKTTTDRFEALRERLLALHPHELPEIIAVEVRAGHAAYLDWVADATRSIARSP
jgi:periplasmic divalent cation tolerance protein